MTLVTVAFFAGEALALGAAAFLAILELEGLKVFGAISKIEAASLRHDQRNGHLFIFARGLVSPPGLA